MMRVELEFPVEEGLSEEEETLRGYEDMLSRAME